MNDSQEFVERLFSQTEMHPTSVDDVLKQTSFLDKMRLYEEHCSCPFDQLSSDKQELLIWARLKQLVNTMMINPCWKQRLNSFGFDSCPESMDEWQNLPITDRETLNDLYMGKRSGLVVPMSNGGYEIVASGGTSGGLPIETVYSIQELRDTYQLSGQHMDKYIFRHHFPQDLPSWVIMTLSDYDMWSSGTMIGGVLQHAESMNFIAAGPMSKLVYNHIMSFDGPKAIMGMSREIESLIELGADVPVKDRESFQLAIYGSGVLQPAKVAELKDTYTNLSILSYFASNQAEAIGLQHNPDDYLITIPGLHFIEVVDENGRWVDEGEEGELVITRLHATEAPILRMQLGDRMIRRPNLQRDGLNTTQIEFSGRSGDIIHLGETHYPAQKVLSLIYQALNNSEIDLEARAAEIQFLNNRVKRELTLLASVEGAGKFGDAFNKIMSSEDVRNMFVQALNESLPLYDQNEGRLNSLKKTTYSFSVKIVERGSSEIIKTKVNKVPLIKDII